MRGCRSGVTGAGEEAEAPPQGAGCRGGTHPVRPGGRGRGHAHLAAQRRDPREARAASRGAGGRGYLLAGGIRPGRTGRRDPRPRVGVLGGGVLGKGRERRARTSSPPLRPTPLPRSQTIARRGRTGDVISPEPSGARSLPHTRDFPSAVSGAKRKGGAAGVQPSLLASGSLRVNSFEPSFLPKRHLQGTL